jgi:hypothetical protein
MIHTIFSKEVRSQKDEFEINYYLETNRKSISIIYEYLSAYVYNYRKYTIYLSCYLRDEYLILENTIKNFERVYNNFAETRKLAIISKYVIYTVSKISGIPLYKLVSSVVYDANGDIRELSTNSFVKGTYKISQRFQELGL